MTRVAAECRCCGDTAPCQEFTLHTRDIVIRDEGFSDIDGESTTGQCDGCLKDYGADDDCGEPPEDDPRTAAEVNGETELELMREWGDY